MTTRQRNINTVAWKAHRTIGSEAVMNGEQVHEATAERVRRAVEDVISSAPNPTWTERDTQATIRAIENCADVDRNWWAGRRPRRHR